MKDIKEKPYTVYVHTNIKNGKMYIGITSKKPEKRWLKGKGYLRCPAFGKAIQKYGWDNFKSEILFKNLTEEDAESKERELIKKHKTQNRKYGYNISNGGTGSGMHSEETKKKISQLQHVSINGKPPRAKKIICLDTLEIFNSICEASKKLPCSETGIREVLQGRYRSSHGLHFEYLDKYDPNKKYDLTVGHTEESKQKIRKFQINNVNNKQVICLETGKIYPSVAETGRQLNMCFSSIGSVCRGKKEHIKGLHFLYLKDYDPNKNYDLSIREIVTKHIVCVETGDIFPSMASAARRLNLNQANINAVCRGSRKTHGGLHFEYYNGDKK